MSTVVAHGIRNPLASIRTSAELCQDDPSPAVREAAADITAEVDRLTEWVRQLLTYSEREPARLDAVLLGPLLEASLQGFERDRLRRVRHVPRQCHHRPRRPGHPGACAHDRAAPRRRAGVGDARAGQVRGGEQVACFASRRVSPQARDDTRVGPLQIEVIERIHRKHFGDGE